METEKHCLRVVVKVGTSTLTHDTGRLNLHNMELLARTLSDLEGMGHEVILVSSGAIAVGTAKMGLKARPTELRMKQAAAAVGQCMMMHLYDKMFGEYNRVVAQILLTGEDVDAPVRAEHLHNTFESLLELGIIPVVNENDSVSSAEIETGKCKVLGDNDTLSAMVARLCRADLLVLLSDIDGLYDAIPMQTPPPGSSTGWRPSHRSCGPWPAEPGPGAAPGAWRRSSAPPNWPWAQAWTWSSPMAPAPRTSTA